MGAGFTGKDAFYLAAYGLDTIAAESDQACIDELTRRNSTAAQPLQIIKTDVLSYQADEPFEVVVCDMVLHFLEADKVPMAVQTL